MMKTLFTESQRLDLKEASEARLKSLAKSLGKYAPDKKGKEANEYLDALVLLALKRKPRKTYILTTAVGKAHWALVGITDADFEDPQGELFYTDRQIMASLQRLKRKGKVGRPMRHGYASKYWELL